MSNNLNMCYIHKSYAPRRTNNPPRGKCKTCWEAYSNVCATRLRRLYHAGMRKHPDAAEWYVTAARWIYYLADRFTLHLSRVRAVVAVTSPRLQWEKQQECVETFLEWAVKEDGTPMPRLPGLKANWLKACYIMQEQDVSTALVHVRGPKVTAFYSGLCANQSPSSYHTAVTLDRHAIRAAMGLKPKKRLANKRYVWPEPKLRPELVEALQRAYREAAERVWVNNPHVLQAVVWVYWRNKWNT